MNEVSPSGTAVATPRADSPPTLASSFTSLKLDSATSLSPSPELHRVLREIPRIGHPDDRTVIIDSFPYLEIEGDLDGAYLYDNPEYPDTKLRPIAHSMITELTEADHPDPQATPTQSRRTRKGQTNVIRGLAQGSLSFIPTHGSDRYEGKLWKIFKGKLVHKSASSDLAEYQEIPVVLKITWPRWKFPQVKPLHDDMFEGHGNHTSETAWTEALHEDLTLRRLSHLQGDIIPNYYGLYSWSEDKIDLTRTMPPDVVVMIMEDAGEQALLRYGWGFGSGEPREILAMYEKLHTIGRTVQSDLRVDYHHIIRRPATSDNQAPRFALVDFQKARSLEGMSKDDLYNTLASDDWVLYDMMGYPAERREEDNLLYDEDGKLIC